MELSARKQFKEAGAYLKKCKHFIFATIFIFFIGSFFGFIFRDNLRFLDEVLKEILLKTEGLGFSEITIFILQNNLQAALFSMIFGIVLIGAMPLFNSITNGVILGYVLGRSYDISGLSQWWRILPHGVFELPAIFIAIALGLRFGFFFIHLKGRQEKVSEIFYNIVNVFLMIVVPLLIIAAIIEGILISFI